MPNFPLSPNALTGSSLRPTALPGAYLGAVDFSQPEPPAGSPQIGCMVDSADLEPAGPVVPYQLLTIFGTGLGPAKAEAATDNSTTTLGGVTVSFGSQAAPLLYVSSNQINVAVPLVSLGPSGTVMQVTVNGVSSPPLQFALASANPSIFAIPGSFQTNSQEFAALALNADGSLNSSTNPAQLGSAISVFVNGLSVDPRVRLVQPVLYTGGGWTVTNYSQTSPFVLKVDLRVPALSANFNCQAPNPSACSATFRIYEITSYLVGLQPGNTGGLAFGGTVYVTR